MDDNGGVAQYDDLFTIGNLDFVHDLLSEVFYPSVVLLAHTTWFLSEYPYPSASHWSLDKQQGLALS